MRNLLRRSSFLVAVSMAITLLSSDILTAEPAGAAPVAQRPSPVVRSTSQAKRPATARRVRPRYTPAVQVHAVQVHAVQVHPVALGSGIPLGRPPEGRQGQGRSHR